MDSEIQEHEVGTTRTPFGFCLKCTHELVAEGDDRCPECGLAFNPRSRRSYYAFQPGWLAKRFLAPPGVLWWLTFLFLSIYLMAASYAPGGFLIAEILGGFALVVAAGFYLLCLISSLLVHLRFGRIWWGPRQLWWLVGPCIVLIGLLLIFLQLPIRVGFSYSRAAMEAQVELAAPGPPASRPAWLGLYPVRYDGADRTFCWFVEPDSSTPTGSCIFRMFKARTTTKKEISGHGDSTGTGFLRNFNSDLACRDLFRVNAHRG